MTTTVLCPQCGNTVPWQDDRQWKPFCSERCKLIDLGEWSSERYTISDESESVSGKRLSSEQEY